eukprot:XP_001703749.1 predicted protein [Chlamydomonas reinhardtii]
MATADWNSLLQQSNDLVGQEYNNVPRVERTLPQLQQYADALRSRTNRFRGPAEHAAATRLLAQQGLDATRLTTEVVALEIVPTIEDVFHADTGNVEEYLQQVEEATLLAAIQEAQQESVASFESYMESCMARDWAANKRQLFGLIAPNNLDNEDKAPGQDTHISSVWALLADVLAEAKQRGLAPSAPAGGAAGGGVAGGSGRYVEALAAGARKHLERGFKSHVRSTISRYKLAAERGADPDYLREVQAYVQLGPTFVQNALVCALLAGDARSMDALGGVLQALQLPPILSTIEDFMWAKLAVVAGSSGGGAAGGGAAAGAAAAASGGVVAGVQPYSLADLQADINRWPPQYYSKQSREPLLYVTVLVLSLQLGAALRFLWRDDTAKPYRLDAGALLRSAPAADRLERIARSGRAAAERLTGAFWQLGVIRDLLVAARRGRHDQALQRLSELPFIPTERSRLDLCVRMSTQLHPAIAERLQDIISTAADSIAARRQQVGREAAAGLAGELAVITAYANSMAGARLPQAVYRKLAEAQVFMS